MSRLDELIAKLCPNGVKYLPIKECVNTIKNIKWTENIGDEFQYIDLSSVDRESHQITETQTINAGNAPSRAQQIVKTGDILFATTRPMLKRFCLIDENYNNQICSTGFCVLRVNEKITSQKWIYYQISSTLFFNHVEKYQKGASYPAISDSEVKSYRIPLPPLAIQEEIIRILDNFTELSKELSDELSNELSARKKQYEYYRDELLSFYDNDHIAYKKIGGLAKFRRGSFPQPYGNSEWYDGAGAMPFVQVADIGNDMRLVPNTKRKISTVAQPKSVFAPKGSIIISLQGSIGRIAVTQYDAYIDRTVAIFKDLSKDLLPKYFVYQLQRIFAIKEKTARGSTIKTITKEEFTDFSIPIPSLEEQSRIVSILDHFDTLTTDITTGLPAEIEARRKQYEYYRDKLLNFQEA